jgi:secondary thiamine-phosphate synthase enzyme
MHTFTVKTSKHTQLLEITSNVQRAVAASGVRDGVCVIFIPHTTAGLTLNENADPDVIADLLDALDQAVPWKSPRYRHGEGNTAAHVKSSMMGHSAQVLICDGQLQLGKWQGIFLCEFDGPRTRNVWVKCLNG